MIYSKWKYQLKMAILISMAIYILHGETVLAFTLTSHAFQPGEFIPAEYTCDGGNSSPALQWTGAPQNTQSFVLIVNDPDAPGGVWDHWVLFNIPSSLNHLEAHLKTLPKGVEEGKNSWGTTGYRGPCPPSGTHRYYFKLYALDTLLQLKSGANNKELTKAMQKHTLDMAELFGKYKRTN